MWDFFIRNNRFAYLFIVALIGVGTFSVLNIPRESSPEVIVPIGVVTTVLPGAPAADIETLVTNEIERGLTGLEGVDSITSVSREGVSSVTVEFDASADVDESIQELKDEVDLIQSDLPSTAEDSIVSEVNLQDSPVLTVALSGSFTDQEFTAITSDLEAEIETIAGVSRVEFSGVRDRQVSVLVDQAALDQFGITLNTVIDGLRAANQTFPIGQIENNGISYNVAFEGDIASSEVLGNVGIANVSGQPILVRDIARVEDGLSPASSLSRLSVDGAPSESAVEMNVFNQTGGDVTRVTTAVNERLAELQAENEVLDGITLAVIQDSGELILDDLINLSTSGLQTIILVVLLLVVAIGWREGLIAGTAIPLSFLFGFIGLYFSGNSINFLSLFSLILGIGILVDSAIVMVEGINRRMKEDPNIDKREAAVATVREFAAPLTAGTLTTVAMFSGLFIVSGVIGQFIFSIPFTIIFLLLASIFVALFIVPLIASQFLRRRSTTKLEQKQNELSRRLEGWYRHKLDCIIGNKRLERRFIWGVRAGLVGAILLPVIGLVPVVFFEQGDVDFVIVQLENAEGTVKEVTDIGIRRVEEFLYDKPYIESFSTTVGSGSQFAGGSAGEKFANITVNLREDRDVTSTEVIDAIRTDLAVLSDLNVTVDQPSDGPPTGAAVVIKFLGDDLSALTRLANESANVLRNIPNTVNIETSTNNNNTEFVINLDNAKATALGVSPSQVSQVARTALFGADATSLTTLNDSIDVVVKLNLDGDPTITADTSNQISISDLERLTISSPTGPVTLSSVADVTLRESSTVINHEDGERVVSVTANVGPEGNAREIQATAVERIQSEVAIPDGITLSTGGGEAEESNEAFIEMFLALIIGIGLMVGILILQFNSFLHTRYVLSILPYSLIGVLGGLAITQNPLSFPSIMGFIALSGIVVNNSILLIDMMNNLRRKDMTRPIKDVVLDAATNRLRPILLTTITTIFGVVPLLFAGSIWVPLVYALIFGLLFAVVITLFTIPITYARKPGSLPGQIDMVASTDQTVQYK